MTHWHLCRVLGGCPIGNYVGCCEGNPHWHLCRVHGRVTHWHYTPSWQATSRCAAWVLLWVDHRCGGRTCGQLLPQHPACQLPQPHGSRNPMLTLPLLPPVSQAYVGAYNTTRLNVGPPVVPVGSKRTILAGRVFCASAGTCYTQVGGVGRCMMSCQEARYHYMHGGEGGRRWSPGVGDRGGGVEGRPCSARREGSATSRDGWPAGGRGTGRQPAVWEGGAVPSQSHLPRALLGGAMPLGAQNSNGVTNPNDAAVLVLSESVDEPTVPLAEALPQEITALTIIGWGHNDTVNNFPDDLMEVWAGVGGVRWREALGEGGRGRVTGSQWGDEKLGCTGAAVARWVG